MWARRLSNRLMIAGPLVLVAAIAINGRGGAPQDDRAVFGPENHKRLLQYVEPVRAADELSQKPQGQEQATLDKAVALWSGLADEAMSVNVMPVDFEVPSQDTVLGNINESKQVVLFHLEQKIERDSENKDFDACAIGLVQAMKIASVDKYTEFSAVHQFGQVQSRYATVLAQIAPKVSPEVRKQVVAELEKLTDSGTKLQTIVSNMRDIHCASMGKKNKASVTIELSEGYGAVAELVQTRSDAAMTRLREVSVRDDMPLEMASVGSVARLAVKSETTFQTNLGQALAALQSVK